MVQFHLATCIANVVARSEAGGRDGLSSHDARGQPIVIPALALAGASLDTRSEEGDDLLAGLELLEVVTVAPLSGAEQAARLRDRGLAEGRHGRSAVNGHHLMRRAKAELADHVQR